jgi:hypothetical protein
MQAVTIHPADESAGFLVVRITVTCEVCGEHEIVVAGHHLKPLLAMLQSVVDEVDPALVDAGDGGTVCRTTQHLFDPRTN